MVEAVDGQTLADAVGVSPSRIRQHVLAGMPKLARNSYDMDVCLTWIEDNRAHTPAMNKAPVDEDHGTVAERTAMARLEHYKAQSARSKLAYQREVREVVPVAMMTEAVRMMGAAFRGPLDDWVNSAGNAKERDERRSASDELCVRARDATEAAFRRLAGVDDTRPESIQNSGRMGGSRKKATS